MAIENRNIELDITGLGIVFYSPKLAEHITEDEDYLSDNYMEEEQVQAHIQKGSIVGFGTGSPGTFILNVRSGYPDEQFLMDCEYKLRLGLHCVGGRVCFRDLYDLMEWSVHCPEDQVLDLDDGFYHVTLCSDKPESGRLGDSQVIHFYLQSLPEFPKLSPHGIPSLC